jgi:LacI family transcriptional regulator
MADPTRGAGHEKVTIYEVARRAGVSIATVSHALNRPDRVSPSTRERVLDAVDELGFTPKSTAVSQARKGLGRIGVLAPFTRNAGYSARFVGVVEAAGRSHLEVVALDAPSSTTALLRTLPTTGRLDGLIIMGVSLDDDIARRLADGKLPTVLVDGTHKDLHSVNVDDETGGYLVGELLAACSHRSVAVVTEGGQPEYVSAEARRIRGLSRALREAGLGEDALTFLSASADLAGGRDVAGRIAGLDLHPTAVVASNDSVAAGAVTALRAAGHDVPGQFAVTGYDGSELADALGITTVRQPLVETGHIATSLLMSMLDGTSRAVQHINLAPELVVRSTT